MRKLLGFSLVAALVLSVSPAFAKKPLDLSKLSESVKEEVLKRFPNADTEKLSLSEVDEIIRYLQLKPQFDRIREAF